MLKDMKLLNVPVIRQTRGLCGPYALAAVLRFYGRTISLKELVRLSGATRQHGTPPEGLLRAARRLGFSARSKRWAEIGDLTQAVSRGTPPLVLWFSIDEGHYSVVVGVDRTHVDLVDPELGRTRKIPRDAFRRTWFDFSTSGPEKGARLYARWMLLVEPKNNVGYASSRSPG